jgi:hypothetical protein
VSLKLWMQKCRLNPGRHAIRDWLNEERHWCSLDACDALALHRNGRWIITLHDQGHYVERHDTALGIVHELPIPQPLLGFSTELALFTDFVSLRHQAGGLAEVVACRQCDYVSFG